jgi:hypothetical protein
MKQFNNINEVITYFASDDKCRETLEKMRWPDGNIICPICGTGRAYRNSDCKTYKCKSRTCMSRFSVTVGTMMEGSKLPLAKWFTALYLITAHKKGISSCQLARDLGIGQKAAWFVLHRCRAMLQQTGFLLEGRVEIDECYVGGKWANMSKKKRAIMADSGKDNKTPVMGMVERDGLAKMTLIGKNTFKDMVRQNVDTDAYINTDEHLGYWGLNKEFADHSMVNHSRGEYRVEDVHTNTVEGMFGLFKRMVFGIYHQISPKHLQSYCDEMIYRYNTRKVKDIERFMQTLKQTEGRLTYKQLTGK